MREILSKLKYIALTALLALSAYNISKTTLEIYGSSKRVDELKTEVDGKVSENDSLKKELSYKETKEFVEEEARNKLNLVKPGESVLIPVKNGGDTLGISTEPTSTSVANASNLERWYRLFFDNAR